MITGCTSSIRVVRIINVRAQYPLAFRWAEGRKIPEELEAIAVLYCWLLWLGCMTMRYKKFQMLV